MLVDDIFVVDFSDDGERARRDAAEQTRLRDRYVSLLIDAVALERPVAERVFAVLFEHVHRSGRVCACGCHPRLSALHDDGFDCRCTWDATREADEKMHWLAAFDDPAYDGLRQSHAAEEADIGAWLGGQTGVEANRKTSYAPEQWEGTVDGHTFYFRERHGFWRLELDLVPTGDFANRLVDVGEDGELVTEPVPIEAGEVIAEGIDSELGESPIDHLAFIVRAIRDRLWARQCDHAGALFFCPMCGDRVAGP
jgi:hypothetical protein